ncbi:twitching motility protein PilT [Sulfolobus acidocaldarius SUSAZ]|nr:twitching motility protein PilT [Sulfolobus acidocaldarius SUSAZ]
MIFFIDSNIFVYSKINDKKYGECCKRIVRDIYAGKINGVIDSVNLLEIANALRKLGIRDVEEEILAILSLPIRVVDVRKEDVVEAVKHEGLSPYDSLHLLIAKRFEAKIISADKDFKDRIDPCNV